MLSAILSPTSVREQSYKLGFPSNRVRRQVLRCLHLHYAFCRYRGYVRSAPQAFYVLSFSRCFRRVPCDMRINNSTCRTNFAFFRRFCMPIQKISRKKSFRSVRIVSPRTNYLPVLPKPPPPLSLSSSLSVISTDSYTQGSMTSCDILSPRCT